MEFRYEPFSIPYVKPAKPAKYKPDFLLLPSYILVETKGRFVSDDRAKHLDIRDQHPELDIRFVFSDPNARIGKQSLTTYAAWCQGKNPAKAVFQYAAVSIPQAWMDAPPNLRCKEALETLGLL